MMINADVHLGWVVYRITNLINQKSYVGVTGNLRRRLQGHMTAARCGRGKAIHAAIRKYGASSFAVDVLDRCSSREEALAIEQCRISEMGTQVGGYNLTAGGDGVRSLVPEVADRLRASLSCALRGKPKSVEHRAAMSECRKGVRFSTEHRKNISLAAFGRRHSDEAKAKMSLKRKGVPLSAEHREKIAASLLGRVFSDAWREAIRQAARANRGRRVECVDLGKSFSTIVDAAAWLRELGYARADTSAIGRACRGKVPRAYGYSWRYADSAEDSIAYSALKAEALDSMQTFPHDSLQDRIQRQEQA